MSLADELAFGLYTLIQEQGGTITFRNVTTLTGANPAPNPPTYISPVVDGHTLAGASSLNTTVSPGGIFTGRLLPGDKFQIAGDSTVYAVTNTPISPPTDDTLTGVQFTPVLAQDAADQAAVTLTSFVADTTLQASVTDYPSILVNGTTIQEKDHRVRFLASDLPGVEIEAGDIVILPDGEVTKVINASHAENQGFRYGWFLHVRA